MKITSIQNNNYNQSFIGLKPGTRVGNKIGVRTSGSQRTKEVIKQATKEAIAEFHPEILTPTEKVAINLKKNLRAENQKRINILKQRHRDVGVYMENGVVIKRGDLERQEGLRMLEEFKANNDVMPNPNAVCELIIPLMKLDASLINEPINDYGITPIMAFVTINPENVDQDKYKETISYLKSRPAIDFNVKDRVKVPLIEMAILGENPDIIDIAIRASNSYEAIEYYPILDKICENMASETLKKNLQENLNVKFPDIEKAFELKSMDALKMLDGQFNSPFYKK